MEVNWKITVVYLFNSRFRNLSLFLSGFGYTSQYGLGSFLAPFSLHTVPCLIYGVHIPMVKKLFISKPFFFVVTFYEGATRSYYTSINLGHSTASY